MSATELTPSEEATLNEIREVWQRIKSAESKVPTGSWVRQVETYSGLVQGLLQERLLRLELQPAAASLALKDPFKAYLEIWKKCTDLLLSFAKRQ